jgi:hypothetical protein
VTNDQMREAFEAAIAEGHQVEWLTFEIAWQAAYRAGQRSQGRRDAYNKGYAAGMERAAGICDDCIRADTAADAIRAEIPPS